jgi:hypothetical protein
LAWPAVVAVIALVLLTTQRRPIGRLIERIHSVKSTWAAIERTTLSIGANEDRAPGQLVPGLR